MFFYAFTQAYPHHQPTLLRKNYTCILIFIFFLLLNHDTIIIHYVVNITVSCESRQEMLHFLHLILCVLCMKTNIIPVDYIVKMLLPPRFFHNLILKVHRFLILNTRIFFSGSDQEMRIPTYLAICKNKEQYSNSPRAFHPLHPFHLLILP